MNHGGLTEKFNSWLGRISHFSRFTFHGQSLTTHKTKNPITFTVPWVASKTNLRFSIVQWLGGLYINIDRIIQNHCEHNRKNVLS